MRAHTEGNAEDAYLHYFVVSENGQSLPLRLQDRTAEQTGEVQRQIIVFGRDNVSASVMLPHYTVEDCDPERQLFVDRRLLPNTESEFELTARLRDIAAAEPMQPVRYRWDFGNGEKAETTVPYATFDFGGRPQDTLFTQILIKCEAVAADGETVMGRTSLQLLNPAFEELAGKGLVRLSIAMNPRFPEMDARGLVKQTVRIWHHRPDPVKITRIIRVRNPMPDEAGQLSQPLADEIPPEEILGPHALIPPFGVLVVAELDSAGRDQAFFSIDYFLEGVSLEGWPAHGNFSILRPPPKPTPESSRPVMSKYMEAKIRRAMELTGKDTVTDEDIWRLEKEGAMADLREEDFPPPQEEPEPFRPDPPPVAPVPPASFENR